MSKLTASSVQGITKDIVGVHRAMNTGRYWIRLVTLLIWNGI